MRDEIWLSGWVFVVVFVSSLAIYLAARREPGRKTAERLETRLHQVKREADAHQPQRAATLIRNQPRGLVPALDRAILGSSRGAALSRFLDQAGLEVTPSTVVLLSLAMGLLAYVTLAFSVATRWVPSAGAVFVAVLPFLVIAHRRQRRLRRFEDQFPEALDLIARALRAGHAFNTGLKMIAEEMGEPVGREFRKTFDEQNFGLSLKDSLSNLTTRVPLVDVRFFATAVLVQRETGGNLAEILDNLSRVVRERFKILRQLRVYTAHGRLTGYVLLGLPPALCVVLMFVNPAHVGLLFHDPLGQGMLFGVVVLQTVGYLWIRRVVTIEV